MSGERQTSMKHTIRSLRILLFFACLSMLLAGTALSVSASQILSTNTDDNTISLIDTVSNSKQTLNVSDGPSKLILTPDKTKAITTLRRGNGIAIIDIKNWKVEATVKTGRKPVDLLLLNNKVYVGNVYGGTVAVVDLTTKTLTKTIEVKAGPSSLAVLQQGESQQIAVLNRNSGMISLIDPKNDTVVAEIDIGSLTRDPVLLAITQDGSKAFIADARLESLLQLDPANNFALVNSFPLGEVSEYNQIYLGNKYLIISDNVAAKGEIQIINTEDKSSFSISLDKKAKGIDFSAGVIYVASNDVITMINRETNIEKDFAAGKGVTGVAVLQEDYVPLGDTEVTKDETKTTGAQETTEPRFPWTRILILLGILVAIILFLRSKHDDEEGDGEKKEESSPAAVTSPAASAATESQTAEEKKAESAAATTTQTPTAAAQGPRKIPLTPRRVVPKPATTVTSTMTPKIEKKEAKDSAPAASSTPSKNVKKKAQKKTKQTKPAAKKKSSSSARAEEDEE